MDDRVLSDFGHSEVQLRWNLERSILVYDQMTVAGDAEPRRRLKMLDGILSTALKLAKALAKRAAYEQGHTPKSVVDNDICVCEVSQMLILIDAIIAR